MMMCQEFGEEQKSPHSHPYDIAFVVEEADERFQAAALSEIHPIGRTPVTQRGNGARHHFQQSLVMRRVYQWYEGLYASRLAES